MKPGEYGEPRINQSKRKTSSAEREETTVHRPRRARDQERAANRRAGERVVSLEVEVGDFGNGSVINPGKTLLVSLTMHIFM